MAFTLIPLGVLVLFLNILPDFTMNASVWFWTVFGILNAIAYYFLWKPILQIVSNITVLIKSQEATKYSSTSLQPNEYSILETKEKSPF